MYGFYDPMLQVHVLEHSQMGFGVHDFAASFAPGGNMQAMGVCQTLNPGEKIMKRFQFSNAGRKPWPKNMQIEIIVSGRKN